MKKLIAIVFVSLSLLLSSSAQAVLTIEITQGVNDALPIAILPFAWSGKQPPPQDVAAIVSADLQRSGRFAPLARDKLPKSQDSDFVFWRKMGMDHLVVGKMMVNKKGIYTVQFQLFDVVKGQQMAGYSMSADAKHIRTLAHRISDIVFQKLTGTPGAFDTKIAYITAQQNGKHKKYSLDIADSDGYDEQVLLTSKQPLMSPSWSPDASKLAYVSFESGRPAIYIQDIRTGQRQKVASYPGINGAPAWSPDGKSLAMTLSRDGNAEIYVYQLTSKQLFRITHHYAIDTEACWAPDGRSLVFTSDRGGQPQLYRVALDQFGGPVGRPQRLSFDGNYNSRASYSPDGKYLAFVHRVNGRFTIAVMDLKNQDTEVVANTQLGESPSFAPNSAMVIYAAEYNGKGVLEVASVDGRARQRLALQSGDVREPAWSPYLDKQ